MIHFKTKTVALLILVLSIHASLASMNTTNKQGKIIIFNDELLSAEDKKNIDLSLFSRDDFLPEGIYDLQVEVNGRIVGTYAIQLKYSGKEEEGAKPCFTRQIVKKLNLTEAAFKTLNDNSTSTCIKLDLLKGTVVNTKLSEQNIYINIPANYLEQDYPNWDPPSRWDDGIPGVLLDYYVDLQKRMHHISGNDQSATGMGTAGLNAGPWRLRGDWRAASSENTKFRWDRIYAWRAIPQLKSKLSAGEIYNQSSIFDSFLFRGAMLKSDESMLPPALRGYAPEITGIARSNAKVIVSQGKRILYETQVAAGPFRIQDMSDSISGQLEVEVQEQDGSTQRFNIDTASIPYLTRPGSVQYAITAGKPSDIRHRVRGPVFSSGELSWGVSNGWSLYGGLLAGQDYQAAVTGFGRDLLILGAVSLDATESRAVMPDKKKAVGRSYRLSYSKSFDEIKSQVTFAGYRFSERNFMNMDDYLNTLNFRTSSPGSKEMYTISFSKQLTEADANMYINYNRRTYWHRPASEYWALAFSKTLRSGLLKNASISVSAYTNEGGKTRDNGGFLNLSIPFGQGLRLGGGASFGNDNRYFTSVSGSTSERTSFQASAGKSRRANDVSGYLDTSTDFAELTGNADYSSTGDLAGGVSIRGGITMTAHGGAFHRVNAMGDTRLLIDTDGVSNVPVRGYGDSVMSNRAGKAVISDINSYYRNQISVDIENLNMRAEALNSVTEATLTEGAVGYRHFDILSGDKELLTVSLPDGSAPPLGAVARNMKGQDTGIFDDNGVVYLSGIRPGEKMDIIWGGKERCSLHFPQKNGPAIDGSKTLVCTR